MIRGNKLNNVSKVRLGNVVSCSVDNQLRAFGLYDFIQMMNSAPGKVTASLDIRRHWFNETIFRDGQHFTILRVHDHDAFIRFTMSFKYLVRNY